MSERYQIQGKIGQGGLGAVYKAFDTQLKREVALKRVLTPEEGSDDEVKEAAEKLLKEATVLSALMHPNIVTIFDIGQDDSGGFVVMELLDGETLDETISRGLLTLRDFTEVVNQTLEAMIAAQAVPLLHRDLKPTNVMVIWRPSGKFQIKILDFGLAKISEQPSIQTIDHGDAILGSIYFMAPEQFERRKLDFRTDMYALGCIYYYSLTGKYPFDGESAPQVMAAHLQHKVKTLKEIRPDLPDEICQWVMWLINRDMTKRPGNAREALERFPGEGGGGGFVAPVVEEEVVEAIPVPEPEPAAAGATRPRLKTGPTPTAKRKTATGRTSTKVPLKPTGRVKSTVATGHTTGHQRSSHVEAAAQLQMEAAAKKKKMVLFGIWAAVMLVVLGIVAKVILGRLDKANVEDRMEVLINADPPRGTIEDVDMLVGKLSGDDYGRAVRILHELSGSGVHRAIVDHLKKASSGSVRTRLIRIVASRGEVDGLPIILDILKSTRNDEEIKAACASLSRLAESKPHVKAMLPLLAESKIADGNRLELEWAILSTIRLERNVENRCDELLARLDSASGPERKSLCKIMGSAGGKKVLTRMETIFADGDLDFQRDAMVGLINWPDRGAMKLVESILDSATDPVIKGTALNAFARLAQLPAKNLNEIRNMQKIVAQTDPGAARNQALYQIATARPLPETMDFLNKIPDLDEKAQRDINGIKGDVQRRLDRAVIVKSGELISTAQGEIRGTTLRSGGWTDPNQWLQWLVQIDQPGKYRIEVLAACDGPGGSRLEVVAAGNQVWVDTRRTDSWEHYVGLDAGEFEFKNGLDIVFVRGAKTIQKRIAEIQGIRLTKIGN